jgi:hypothetical protein
MKKITLEERRELKSRLKTALMRHVGPSRKIGMGELFEEVFEEGYEHRINDTKLLRVLVDDLQREGIEVCSSRSRTNGGYWLAATATELNGYCDVLLQEITRKASKVAALKRISLPVLLGQMAMNLTSKNEEGNEKRT